MTSPDGGDWVPRPDPTKLTTDALMREIGALKELLSTSVAGLKELHTYDIAGLRDSIKERFARFEEELDRSDALRNEKFTSINKQLELMERYRVEQKTDNDRNISKSEVVTSTGIDGVNRSLADVKDRVTVLESLRLGMQQNTAVIYGGVSLIVTLGLLAVGVLTFFANR